MHLLVAINKYLFIVTEIMFVSKNFILKPSFSYLNKIPGRKLTIKPKSFLSPGSSKGKSGHGPPYNHFVQIGDPVLRATCDPVNPTEINTEHIQSVIAAMKYALKRFDGVGVSAPQIGVPLQIMMVQFTSSQLKCWTEEMQEKREMEEIPLKVFINPKLQILDPDQVSLTESCCSMHGFSALVPRSRKVSLTGLDQNGKEGKWSSSGWAARIAQHEYDHLSGKMFVDRAMIDTLTFDYWNIVNSRLGEFKLGYAGIKAGPRKWLTSGWFLKQAN